MDLEGQRRARTRDNPMAIVIVFDLGNDRDAFVVGDEPAGKFGNKLKKMKAGNKKNAKIDHFQFSRLISISLGKKFVFGK